MLMSKNSGGEARLHYSANSFRVLRHGSYVTCAMSGVPVPLDELRYWSVDLQEAYASAKLATERLKP